MKKHLFFYLVLSYSLLIAHCSFLNAQVEWKLLNKDNSWLPNNYIMKTAFDSTGSVWIATWGKGLYKFDGANLTNYSKSNSQLPNDFVSTIFLDDKDIKWIGTYQGLARYDGNSWKIFTTSNALLPDDNIKAIAEDSKSNIYAATNKGGMMKYNNQGWTFYNKSTPQNNTYIPNNSVNGIAIDSNDYKWVGTNGSGIGEYNNNIWKTYAGSSYLPSDTINGIDVDSYSDVWIATAGGLVFYDGNTWRTFNKSNTSNFPANNVTAVKLDDNDNVWFGIFNKTNLTSALGMFNGVQFSFYNYGTSGFELPNNTITDINFDFYNNAWISTFGGGISIFDENGIINLLSVDELNKNKNTAVVYPNPCRDKLNISFIHPLSNAAVLTLTDITGKIILTITQNSKLKTINTANLSKGIYILNIVMDDKVINRKIIKQ